MPQEKQDAKPTELKDEELKGVDGGTLTGRTGHTDGKILDTDPEVEEQ